MVNPEFIELRAEILYGSLTCGRKKINGVAYNIGL